jgi:hypothetical protein
MLCSMLQRRDRVRASSSRCVPGSPHHVRVVVRIDLEEEPPFRGSRPKLRRSGSLYPRRVPQYSPFVTSRHSSCMAFDGAGVAEQAMVRRILVQEDLCTRLTLIAGRS